MKKSELVAAVAAKTNQKQATVEAILNATLDTIVDAVAAGDKIIFTGFGSFEKRTRAARQGRNPSTREVIEIPASSVPVFSAGKVFKDAVGGTKSQS
ncbi:MAG: HU family DNA-binding protein [Myxococcota bacterium]